VIVESSTWIYVQLGPGILRASEYLNILWLGVSFLSDDMPLSEDRPIVRELAFSSIIVRGHHPLYTHS
jgi:hypothetical protein